MMKWSVCEAHIEEIRIAFKTLVGKSEGKIPLERHA
jgi:hypothetical protein